MFSKVRTNVILLGLMLVGLTAGLLVGTFGWLGSFSHMDDFWLGATVGAIVTTVLLVTGVSIGALASTMSQVANDPPPPQVPESTIVAVMDKWVESNKNAAEEEV